MRRILLIAFHYPPFGMSSGVQRTLSFSKHLPRYGWQPHVLTVRPEVFERSRPDQLRDIPSGLLIRRTRAFDAARHLAVAGRYWSRLALPDRWASWWYTAVPAGLLMMRRFGIDVIWSTYPIATAHRIGATLARLSGRPWIADFRDPMVEFVASTGNAFPPDPALRKARLRVESQVARDAARLVFCTEGARDIVLGRYPSIDPTRLAVIANGYEEGDFQAALSLPRPPMSPARKVLLHSGTIYLTPDRDPSGVMKAIRSLRDRGVITPASFELRLRDPSNESALERLAERIGVTELIKILPQLPYRQALAEMAAADGLLLLQGETSNAAVPAKLYEYLRAGRPLVACIHDAGETARTLRSVGVKDVAPLSDPVEIASLIEMWFRGLESMDRLLPRAESISRFARESQAGELGRLCDALIDQRST